MAGLTKLATAGVLAVLLSGTPALAQKAWNDGWDADDDGPISEDKLAGGIYDRYDLDDIIEEPELADIGGDLGDEGFWDV